VAVRPSPEAASASSPPRLAWESELQQVESQLLADPGSIHLRVRRGSLLAELGRLADARNDFIQVLEREPHHLAALNNLGSVLIATGHREAAGIAFKEAIARHPNSLIGRVNCGNFLLEESERLAAYGRDEEALQLKREARDHYERALQVDAGHQRAHEGLSYLLVDLGDLQSAAWHRREAFRNRCVIPLPYRGARAPVPLLQLVSTTGGNIRLQRFLDDRIFKTFLVLPEFYDSSISLPVHHLVINGIGDAELSSAALAAAQSMLALTTAPVVNPPASVLATSRSNNAKRFASLSGVVTPVTATLRRESLSGAGAAVSLARHGFAFPFLLRSPGFHSGQHFLLVESLKALPAALAHLPGQDVIVMQYLDARGPDGKTRKYRAMMIDGHIFPLHVAISSHWKVHFFTADMAENPEHRAEDAAFLEDMRAVLGPLAMGALERIQSMLGLDYGGIDFGLNARGEVLLFETNATMVVNPPGPDERWSYRWPACMRIQAAVQEMLLKRANSYLDRAHPP
jgi:hypothetical protein